MSDLNQLRNFLSHKYTQLEVAMELEDTEEVVELREIIQETHRMIEAERSKNNIDNKIHSAKINAVMERSMELSFEIGEEKDWTDEQKIQFQASFSRLIEREGLDVAITEMRKWETRPDVMTLEDWRKRRGVDFREEANNE